jgi:ATP-dependent DNA helicase RecQ
MNSINIEISELNARIAGLQLTKATLEKIQKAVVKQAPPSADDEKIFERLKSRRFDLAKAMRTPAYCVASDKSLRSMIALKPKNLEDMANVFGFAERRTQLYGMYFFEALVNAQK